MFERYTDRSRRVLVLAQEEALQLDHESIGTEDLLVGMILEESGAAAEALKNLGVTLVAARSKVSETVRPSYATSGPPPFSDPATRVLRLANDEALPTSEIGTEHLLLALMNDDQGCGVQVLRDLGVEPQQVRQALSHLSSSEA
jgi:ATP-dependent Clp protease ATP-binding subunit ClpC